MKIDGAERCKSNIINFIIGMRRCQNCWTVTGGHRVAGLKNLFDAIP